MFELILNIIYAIVLVGVILIMIDKIIMLFKNAANIRKMPEKLEEICFTYNKKIDEISNRYDAMVEKSNKQVKEFANENGKLKDILKEYEKYFKLSNDYIIGIDKEISYLSNYINEPNEKLKYELENLMSDRIYYIKKQIKGIEAINNRKQERGYDHER